MTKILFIDPSETTFQFRKCMAQALGHLARLEMIHAPDAEEALAVLDKTTVDVIVFDAETDEELRFFLDSLRSDHPPVIYHCDTPPATTGSNRIVFMERVESLDGIHNTLICATALAAKSGSQHIN